MSSRYNDFEDDEFDDDELGDELELGSDRSFVQQPILVRTSRAWCGFASAAAACVRFVSTAEQPQCATPASFQRPAAPGVARLTFGLRRACGQFQPPQHPRLQPTTIIQWRSAVPATPAGKRQLVRRPASAAPSRPAHTVARRKFVWLVNEPAPE